MAENRIVKYYKDIAKLFDNGPIVQRKIANKIKAPGDIGVPVGTARAFLKSTNAAYASTLASYGQYARLARYSDYQEMESMAEIAAALDIYADETCAVGVDGDVIKIESSNKIIKNALQDLFYDTLNIEFEAWNWIRNMCKFGDQFLLLDHHPDYGVLAALPLPVNEIEREEGFDPDNPLRFRYRWITQGNKVLEKWQIIHFRNSSNDNFLPYGSPVIESARRVWRQLILMEDAVMVYRIVRSPERRVFKIDIGNIPPQDVAQFMEKTKNQLKKNQIIDSRTGRVDLRYNPLSVDEDYFIPIRGEHSSTIESLPGGQYTGDIEDLKYIQGKLFAALKIPKSYLGYEEDLGNKATLSQLDVRFSHTIQRIQRVFLSELNKIAIIHLWSMGLRDEDLLDFELSMANPSMISELQRLELIRAKLEVSAMVPQNGVFDKQFVYDNIWKLPPEEVESIEEGRRKDKLTDLEIDSLQAPQPVAAAMPPMPMAQQPQVGVPNQAGAVPGLPPPPAPIPGQPMQPQPINSGRDPNMQTAAPNDLMLKGKKKSKKQFPDLKNYAFNTKKTAMDPKRNSSELTRMVRAPFGETLEKSNILEENFQQKYYFIKSVQKELQEIYPLNTKNQKK